MRLLLHVCCGPCGACALEMLRDAGHAVDGYFYNPNIHPYTEYERRLEAARKCAEATGLRLIVHDEYDLERFLRRVVFRETERCPFCYEMRLRRTAATAKAGGYEGFTTTLLCSPHQEHETIRSVGDTVGREVGVPFHYADLRPGFKRHRELAEAHGLYRQQYCGCIFSERDRYARRRRQRPRAGG